MATFDPNIFLSSAAKSADINRQMMQDVTGAIGSYAQQKRLQEATLLQQQQEAAKKALDPKNILLMKQHSASSINSIHC